MTSVEDEWVRNDAKICCACVKTNNSIDEFASSLRVVSLYTKDRQGTVEDAKAVNWVLTSSGKNRNNNNNRNFDSRAKNGTADEFCSSGIPAHMSRPVPA